MKNDGRERAAAGVVENPGVDDAHRHDLHHEQPEPQRPRAVTVVGIHVPDEEERQVPQRPNSAQDQA